MTYNHIPTTPHYNTAPASRDAKSCVSRATHSLIHPKTLTLKTYIARETQDFASLLLPTAICCTII